MVEFADFNHGPMGQHTVVAAAIRQAFNQPDKKTAAFVAIRVAHG